MKGGYLTGAKKDQKEGNIYADKSALILDWLLREGAKKTTFSLREVAKETRVSLGLVQRVFSILVLKGLLEVKGIRTAKRFSFKKSKALLENWSQHYSITKKCKMSTYRSALSGKSEWFKALKGSGVDQKVLLALHSAAEAHGLKNTNLETLELYLLDPSTKTQLERTLQLEPQERGYEVLLIEPYYKTLSKRSISQSKGIGMCPILVVFLDLYHFPLRGLEQAEFIAARAVEFGNHK